MLNKHLVITICGRSYPLVTDNPAQITENARAVEKSIIDFCKADDAREKEDAAVLSALSFAVEVSELKAALAAAQNELEQRKKLEEAAKSALQENAALKAENSKLKHIGEEAEKLKAGLSAAEERYEKLSEQASSDSKLIAEQTEKITAKESEIAGLAKQLEEMGALGKAADKLRRDNEVLTKTCG